MNFQFGDEEILMPLLLKHFEIKEIDKTTVLVATLDNQINSKWSIADNTVREFMLNEYIKICNYIYVNCIKDQIDNDSNAESDILLSYYLEQASGVLLNKSANEAAEYLYDKNIYFLSVEKLKNEVIKKICSFINKYGFCPSTPSIFESNITCYYENELNKHDPNKYRFQNISSTLANMGFVNTSLNVAKEKNIDSSSNMSIPLFKVLPIWSIVPQFIRLYMFCSFQKDLMRYIDPYEIQIAPQMTLRYLYNDKQEEFESNVEINDTLSLLFLYQQERKSNSILSNCKACKTPFFHSNRSQIYCSPECRNCHNVKKNYDKNKKLLQNEN